MSFRCVELCRNYDTGPTLLIWPRHRLRLSVGTAGGRVLPVLEEAAAQTNEYTFAARDSVGFHGSCYTGCYQVFFPALTFGRQYAPPAARRGCKEALWTKISKP